MQMLKKWLLQNANMANKNSFSNYFRKKRMNVFEEFYKEQLLKNSSRGVITILDVGGEYTYWKYVNFKYFNTANYTLLNLYKTEVPDFCKNMHRVIGNATDLSEYEDNKFDLVFSNSVIEHVGDFEMQKRMALEMCRVGKHCYLQTPNRYFLWNHIFYSFFSVPSFKTKNFYT